MLFPDLHVIACFLKGSNDSLQRRGESMLRGLGGEQVHVLGGAIDESVFTNGTGTRQRKPCFRACRLQGDPRDPSLLGGIPGSCAYPEFGETRFPQVPHPLVQVDHGPQLDETIPVE